jgi:localization factor PodJL
MRAGSRKSARLRKSDLRAAMRSAAREAGLSLEEWIDDALQGEFEPDEGRGRYRTPAEDRTATSLLNRRIDLIEDMLGDFAAEREDDGRYGPDPDDIVEQLAEIFHRRQNRRPSRSARDLAALLGDDLPVSRHAASDALRSISARLDQLAAKTPGVSRESDIDPSIRNIEDQLQALAGKIGEGNTQDHRGHEHSSADNVIDQHIQRLEQKLDSMAAQFGSAGSQASSAENPLRDMNAAVDQIMARQQAIEAGVAGIPEATAAAQSNRFQIDAEEIRSEIRTLASKIETAKAGGSDAIDRRLQTLLEQIDTATRSELAEMRNELRELSRATEQASHENERRYHASETRFDALAQQMELPARSIAALEDKLATLTELLTRAPDSQAGLSADLAGRIDALSERISRIAVPGDGASGAADPELLAAVDRQLSSLGANIAEIRSQSVGREVLTDVFDRIAGQVQAVNSRLDELLAGSNNAGVETLGDKIDQLHMQLAAVSGADSIDKTAFEAIQRSIDELGHRLEQKAAEGTDAGVLADIQARIDDLARRADAAAQSVLDPSVLHALEGRIAEMAQQFNAISQDAGSSQTQLFQTLSQQISDLAGQVENQAGGAGTAEIKAALSELAARIDGARSQAVDAARQAAQEIVAQGGDTGLVQALKADLENLRAANVQATERTENSLSDMRNVLSSMVGRMSEMDDQPGQPGQPGMPQRQEPRFASAAPMDAGGPHPGAGSSHEHGMPESNDAGPQTVIVDDGNPAQVMADVAADGDEDGLIVREAPRDRPMRAADDEREHIGDRLGSRINQMLNGDQAVKHSAARTGSDPSDEPLVAGIDEDTPLSPGSRRPVGSAIAGLPDVDQIDAAEAPSEGGEQSGGSGENMSGQASASDFIAAARKAAAQARHEDGKNRSGNRRKSKARNGAPAVNTSAKNSPLGRMRKPLVLASAALLLVVGSLKVYEMLNAGAPTAGLVGSDAEGISDEVLDGGPDSLPQAIAPPDLDSDSSSAPADNEDGARSETETPGQDDEGAENGAATEPVTTEGEAAIASPNRASRVVGTGFVPLPAPNVSATAGLAEGGTQVADASASTQSAPLTTGSIQTPDTVQSTPLTLTQPNGAFVPGGFGSTAEGSGIFNDTLPEAIGTAALRKAAQDGDVVAQHEVARRFSEGRAIPQDLEAAADWYQRAAAQGLAPAQYALATLYEKGNGVDQDVAMAEMWYKRAADQGNRKAMYNLAVMLSAGAKGTPDYSSAAPWFRRAAELGLRDSQFNLGVMHARGLGVEQDNIEAYKWFAIAAAQGDNEATGFRDKMAGELSDADKARAMEIAQSWRPARLVPEANFVNVPAALTQGELPRDPGLQEALDPEVVLRATQTLLNRLGYNAGPADGIMGPRTRSAIRSFERSIGWPETGRATPRLLNRMKQAAN